MARSTNKPSVKQYESLVKKISESSGESRSELVEQKKAIAEELRSSCKDRASLRRLKFELDEANNQ